MKTRLQMQCDGMVARVFLAAPKANVLDRVMVEELDGIFAQLQTQRELRAVIIEGDGPHFSFGASVEEHLPDQIAAALARLGALLRRLADVPAPTIAAIRGQCLGGGLELALACDILIAEENAQLGLPEIKLGVFPPAATALLPLRIGVAGASAMILTGESWTGMRALQQGLVARVAPEGALRAVVNAFVNDCLMPRSAGALRHATHAVRRSIVRALNEDLPKLDGIYLDELMAQPDAEEGIRAFVERREPTWLRKDVLA